MPPPKPSGKGTTPHCFKNIDTAATYQNIKNKKKKLTTTLGNG